MEVIKLIVSILKLSVDTLGLVYKIIVDKKRTATTPNSDGSVRY